MNEANGRASRGDSRATGFTPPKGYGGFIPVIDDVAEGEWTLGVVPAPPPSVPASSRGVAEVARPQRPVRPASEALEVGEKSQTGRKALDEIPLRPASTPLQGNVQGEIRGRELPSPSPVRRILAPPPVSSVPRRRSTILWLLVILLALGLAGETWYSLEVMRQHNIQLSRLPGVEQALAALGEGFGASESKLQAPVHNSAAQVHTLEQKVAASLPDTGVAGLSGSKEAGKAPAVGATSVKPSGQVLPAVPAPAGKNPVGGQIVPPQSNPKAHPELQASLPPHAQRRQAAQHGLRSAQAVPANRAASLHRNADQDQTKATSPARQFDRPRVDFEVARNSSREIVPGISLRVTATNVRDQRYDGYLWLMSEGSALWLSNVGVQHPIVFYPRRGGQADQMVVTRITQDSVVGYLLQPVGGAAVQGENSSPNRPPAGLYAEFTPGGKKNR